MDLNPGLGIQPGFAWLEVSTNIGYCSINTCGGIYPRERKLNSNIRTKLDAPVADREKSEALTGPSASDLEVARAGLKLWHDAATRGTHA